MTYAEPVWVQPSKFPLDKCTTWQKDSKLKPILIGRDSNFRNVESQLQIKNWSQNRNCCEKWKVVMFNNNFKRIFCHKCYKILISFSFTFGTSKCIFWVGISGRENPSAMVASAVVQWWWQNILSLFHLSFRMEYIC